MEFKDLIIERRSVRKYKNQPVSEETIKELIKTAQYAPSWKNSQTARYYVINSGEKLESFRKEALPSFNQNNSANATLIVTTFVKGVSGFNGDEPVNEVENGWGAYDLGLQNAYLILKAKDLGLDTLIMGIRHGDKIREFLSIPESEEIVSVIAVGYRDQDPKFNGRKDLDEIVKIY